jgi:NO-binding membrane sensor protein with MHYT domain
VALALLMRREISRTALVVGGVLVGAGIGAMHYIGMEASQWAPIMRFDPWGFAASLLVAVLLAIVALWVRFGLERVVRWQARWLNLAAGAVMGLAIAAPHYVAMAALRFIDAPGELELATTVEGTSLAWRWPLWPWSSGGWSSLSTSACATGRCSCRCNRASPACAPLPTRPWTAW